MPSLHLTLLALTLFLSACKDPIYSRVSEHNANEVLSALLESGVDAEKQAVDEKTFDVLVARSDTVRALAVLRTRGLPREQTQTLGDLFKKDGLVSTPAEERVRYIYGVSQALERTVREIDGVVQSRLHVVIPANDPLSEVKKPSSASVFVKYRPPADPAVLGPLVRSLVMRGIEGLDAEHVSVAFVASEPAASAQPVKLSHWLGLKVAADAVPWLWALLVLPFGALGAYLAVHRGWIRASSRQTPPNERPARPVRMADPRGARAAAAPEDGRTQRG
jgi:type III secretion protein J